MEERFMYRINKRVLGIQDVESEDQWYVNIVNLDGQIQEGFIVLNRVSESRHVPWK